MKGALPDTRGYDGCLGIRGLSNQDDSNNIVLIEEWESRGHYDRYLQWRTDTGFIEAMGGMLAGEPKFTYLEVLDV
jgi:quinol monooxygenase YgiN